MNGMEEEKVIYLKDPEEKDYSNEEEGHDEGEIYGDQEDACCGLIWFI